MDPLTTAHREVTADCGGHQQRSESSHRFSARQWIPRTTILTGFFLLAATCFAQAVREPQFSQAAKAVLDREFAGPEISYLLLDASGNLLAERWPAQSPISPGSLVKPFLAIAYGDQHDGHFPIVHCLGTSTHCWLPPGHGSLGLEDAIAQSCNTYFRELALGLNRPLAAQTFAHYGLVGPAAQAASDSMIGLGTAWKESPLALAKAYLEIEKEQHSAIQSRIIKGMLGSASRGTARGVDAALGPNAALAKTGTAVCSHTPQGAADGFTVVLYPAAQPRLLLLVRVHGVTGAASANVAGAMLRSLGAGQEADKR
jgi:cell division protein FtsI/penicillin-binding protein 2